VIGWKNGDSAGHTATLADDSCGTDTIASGSTGALVFNVAGTYTYKCAIHPTQMKDYTVVVSSGCRAWARHRVVAACARCSRSFKCALVLGRA
jgi:hypothetical protein